MVHIQRHPENWLSDLERQIKEATSAGSGLHAYALIDGAFQPACYRHLKVSQKLHWLALFASTPSANEETLSLSPTLVDLTHPAEWRQILSLTDGWPMTSWIVTPETLEELAQRLQPWCVVDADGQSLVLRFADTRRLPDLVSVLTPDQHAQLFGPATVWCYVGRDAEWKALLQPERSMPAADKIRLDEKQCAKLIASSEADEIVAHMSRHEADIIARFTPWDVYEKVASILVQADWYRLEQPGERLQFCSLLMASPDLAEDEHLHVQLARYRNREIDFDHVLAAANA